MITLKISLLGPLTATLDNQPISFRTDAQRVLLAYLAAHHGMPQRRDTLAGLLSPDRNDKDALTYLRNRLTRLRSALKDDAATPPWLTIDRKQITLRIGTDVIIDVTEFEQRLDAVEKHAHRQLAGCPNCMARLEEAVALVRGEFLAGLNFPSDVWEAWLLGQREHLQQRSMDALTWLRDTSMVHNQWDEVLALAQRQLILEPWHEAAHRAIMQAHHQLGDRTAAITQYEVCKQRLWDEIGVEPETETTALFEQLSANSLLSPATSPPATSPPATSLPATSLPCSNLPLQTTRFFGRHAEQKRLLERLVDPQYRLITLVGTGGIGKTRLAIEVGQQVKRSFPDGVWFIALDAVKSDGEQIKIAVGEAIGLARDDNQLTGDQIGAILRDKQMLLIFDNCETVLDALGFVPTWLNRARDLVILATSREALNFQAESVVVLEGLGIRDEGLGAAESMFAEQAQMARDDFRITDGNLDQVRQICQLVDGLPLGIALAAAWVRRRSLAQIIDSIGQSLDFLSTRMRDVDPRHRSMKAVLEASWQMLDVEKQGALAALSIFPASFTAEAAQQIAGAQVFDLDLFCEKSLLQQQHEGERYQMHSLVRQFAAEKLSIRKQEVEEAFVRYYFDYAQSSQDDYAQLSPEWNNFSAAIAKAYALAAWHTVLDFVEVLDEPWFRQVRFSDMRVGLMLAAKAAKALGDEEVLARSLLRLGEAEVEQNDYKVAESHLTDALTPFLQLEDGQGIARAKHLLGRIKSEQGDSAQALTLFEESKRIYEDEGNPLGIAQNLNLMAQHFTKNVLDHQVAQAYLEQSLSLQRQLQATDSATYVGALRHLARISGSQGQYEVAETYLVEASDVAIQHKDMGEYAAVLYERMVISKRSEQIEVALKFGYDCLDHAKKMGSLRWEALAQTQLGVLCQTAGKLEEALPLFRQSLQIFTDLGDRFEQAYAHYYLFVLYGELNEETQSIAAKESAQRLATALDLPQLSTLLSR